MHQCIVWEQSLPHLSTYLLMAGWHQFDNHTSVLFNCGNRGASLCYVIQWHGWGAYIKTNLVSFILRGIWLLETIYVLSHRHLVLSYHKTPGFCHIKRNLVSVTPNGTWFSAISKGIWFLSYQTVSDFYHMKNIWFLSYQKVQLDFYHFKRHLVSIIPKGTWFLSYQKAPGFYHTKRYLIYIISKGTRFLSYQNKLVSVISKGIWFLSYQKA